MPLTSEEKRELIMGMATAETILCDCAQEMQRDLRAGRQRFGYLHEQGCRTRAVYSPMDCASLGLLLRHRGESA
jgi:hypothetical protein